jgi:hypothetical protein
MQDNVTERQPCRFHHWERGLEVRAGVQRVVRVCGRCGRKEECWSERRLPAKRKIRSEFAEELASP